MRVKLGKVGKFSDTLNREFDIWKAVDSGISLSELDRWTLEELDIYIAYLDYKQDMEMAVTKAMRDEPQD